ncbi:MAG: prolyl oligopeptidase family serine peptidase [Phycisphaerales bacterium]
MIRHVLACVLVFASGCSAQPSAPAAPPGPEAAAPRLTLEQIMADPDWIGNAPERPYWADDSRSVYYSRKKPGSDERELIQIDRSGTVLRVVQDADRPAIDVPGGDVSADLNWKVYSRAGDLYLKDLLSGQVRQLTRTAEDESGPRFMRAGDRIVFQRGGATLIRDIATGFEEQPADLRAADDPDKKKEEDGDLLKQQQDRLFDFLRERKRKQDEGKERDRRERDADTLRAAKPWYLGADVDIRESNLSPDERWMLVRLAKKGDADGKRDTMPQYVSETGYVDSRAVRSKVGTGKPVGESLVLLDLEKRVRHDLDLSVLPGIADDPLKELREAAEKRRKEEKEKREKKEGEKGEKKDKDEMGGDAGAKEGEGREVPEASSKTPQPRRPGEDEADAKEGAHKDTDKKDEKPKPRPVSVRDIEWSDDGSRVVVQVFSLDSKDRWVAGVDFEGGTLVPLERDTEEAWINGRFTQLGWVRDTATIWFLSERTGWSHLYLRDLAGGGDARGVTSGEYEVSDARPSRDGRWLYYTANAEHPGVFETWRADARTGATEPLTKLGGGSSYVLSPDGSTLLLTHSTPTRPPELFIQPAQPGATATKVTTAVSAAFTAIPWQVPRFVEVAGRGGIIHTRLYLPESAPPQALRPAVLFVHGAGYLQNAHKGWSTYFREFMFHNLLVQRGYVVLDMDYRASAGYGRDWRTAIYRCMGTPELEDLEDGVKWLVEHHNVDPARVGVYGGSYGGFLTLMALFTKPDLFACGAALRPVTDWAHYNHGYTANILNTPEVDPEAYERSSPIEFAAGLKRPLLICHGMQDDNVFFQDTVRLAQRLIELEKPDWEVAAYPIEPHAFQTPKGWLDEYRRILKLFETYLKDSNQQRATGN